MGKTLSWNIQATGTAKTAAEFNKLGASVAGVGEDLEELGAEGKRAADKLAAAQQKAADSLGKVRVAELKLSEVRDGAKESQRVAAEEALAAARRRAAAAADSVADAQKKLNSELTKPSKPIKVPVDVDTSGIKSKLDRAGGDAGKAGSGAGKQFGGNFLAGMAGVPIAGTLASIAGDAFAKASEKSKVKASLQNQMGITPDQAKDYGDRVGRAYAGGLGDSKDQIASVYATLSSDVRGWSSMTTSEQDKVAKNMTKVVQGMGIDLPSATKAASSAISNGLVPDWLAAQDLLVTGFQTLGSRGDDFADTLGEYSGYFKNLGFDGATALGVLQQGLQAGARDTDYIADAFKELNIRVIDGSKEVGEALKGLGLDAKKIPEAIAQGGPAALGAVDSIIDRIKAVKDPIKQNEIGVKLFGTQWEDTMKQIVSAIDINMAQASTKYQGAVDKMAIATDTNVDRFQRRWENGLSIVGEKLAGFANDGASLIDGFANHLAGTLDKDVGGKGESVFKGLADALLRAKTQMEKEAIQVKVQTEWKKVQDIHDRLKGLPPKTPVVVDALTGQARTDLESLGYQVKTLPGGKIQVSADSRSAIDTAQRTVNWLNSLYATIRVGVVGVPKGIPVRNPNGGRVLLAEGGWVHGPGTTTSDSVPTMLSNKEFVVSADNAAKNAAALEAINSGRSLAGFATAGMGAGMGGGMGSAASVVNVVIRVDPNSGGLARELGKALRHEIQAAAGGDPVRYFRSP